MSDSLWPNGLYNPWNSPGQNIGVGSLSLLQGIFPAQGSNPGLLICRRILYQLRYQGRSYHCFTINNDKIGQGLWGSSPVICVPSSTHLSCLRDCHESSPTFSWNLWWEALFLLWHKECDSKKNVQRWVIAWSCWSYCNSRIAEVAGICVESKEHHREALKSQRRDLGGIFTQGGSMHTQH